jgi:hypothetical protein
MKKPHEIHWKSAKRTLQHVWGTVYLKMHYNSGGLLYWLVSLIHIGLDPPMIEIVL